MFFVLIFLLLISVWPGYKIGSFLFTQRKIDTLVQNGGYSEIKGKAPTFRIDIKSADSTTHVLSYLPKEVLPREKFNVSAAEEAISNVEEIVKERNTFVFNPFARDGFEVSMKIVHKWHSGAEHYVFFISEKDPVPGILLNNQKNYPLLSDSIQNGKTFFWTQSLESGSVSFVRYAEPKTWQYGLPSIDNTPTTPIQQLNIGFNIEIWKRTAAFQPEPKELQFENHPETVFGANESLWNTFGQLMIAKQEGTPVSLMKWRHNNAALSEKRNRGYYPFDEKAQKIYNNAPVKAIIK